MHVCIYVCIYVMYVCMHVMYVMYVCMYVFMYVFMYVCMCTYKSVFICVYISWTPNASWNPSVAPFARIASRPGLAHLAQVGLQRRTDIDTHTSTHTQAQRKFKTPKETEDGPTKCFCLRKPDGPFLLEGCRWVTTHKTPHTHLDTRHPHTSRAAAQRKEQTHKQKEDSPTKCLCPRESIMAPLC